jgi:hypothetical protein
VGDTTTTVAAPKDRSQPTTDRLARARSAADLRLEIAAREREPFVNTPTMPSRWVSPSGSNAVSPHTRLHRLRDALDAVRAPAPLV